MKEDSSGRPTDGNWAAPNKAYDDFSPLYSAEYRPHSVYAALLRADSDPDSIEINQSRKTLALVHLSS
jgi:hypothetical protein